MCSLAWRDDNGKERRGVDVAREYSPEVKAAVMAALLTGQSVSSISKEYKIPKGTVSGWKDVTETLGGSQGVATQKREQISDLLFDYLVANLKSIRVQVEHFGDKTWLTKQTADALAVLHGVTVDKAVRLLEALTANDSIDTLSAGGDEEV